MINLDDSRSRWIQCYRNLATLFPPENIRRVAAIDGLTFSHPSSPHGWRPDHLRQLQKEGYLPEEGFPDPVRTALCLSHQRALREFLNLAPLLRPEDDHWALILEDDARSTEALHDLPTQALSLPVPADAELLFLHDRVMGRSVNGAQALRLPSAVSWNIAVGGIGLEAYLVSMSGARKMLAAWKPLGFECDIQLMPFVAGYADTSMQRWVRKGVGKTPSHDAPIQAYVSSPPLFSINPDHPSVKLERLRKIEQVPATVKAKATSETTSPRQALHLALDSSIPLAFATPWFNPFHYRSRVENFFRFLEGSKCRNLAVVELAFGDDDWQLPDDVPNLIRLRSNTVCWQKEAMLNIAFKQLDRAGFPYLGWIDADVQFATPDWEDRVIEELQSKTLCQIFEHVDTIFPDRGPLRSIGSAANWVSMARHPFEKNNLTGFGWAMHREVWQAAGLFDQGILGSGDHIMWRAAFHGYIDRSKLFVDRTCEPGFAQVREQWAERWALAVGLKIGFARGVTLASLPHGTAQNRQYMKRGLILREHQYEPAKHLTRDEHGLLQWTDLASQSLRQAVEGYFARRQEDE